MALTLGVIKEESLNPAAGELIAARTRTSLGRTWLLGANEAM